MAKRLMFLQMLVSSVAVVIGGSPTLGADNSPSNLPLVYEDDFENTVTRWRATDAKAWRVTQRGDNHVYSLFQQSDYKPPYRSPLNISLVNDIRVTDFELNAKVKTTTRDYGHRSMCLFFGYQDSAHFYYVHLGQEADDHANQIFIVNGAPRTKISTKTTTGTPWDDQWHQVRITRHVDSGSIAVYWDDMEHPIMTATDTTFAWGQVGLGSFDDTGDWDQFKLFGVKHDLDASTQ